MTNKARTKWLQKLVGDTKAEEVIADTEAAIVELDKAGITRKAFPPEEEEKKPEGEAVPSEGGEKTPTPSEEAPVDAPKEPVQEEEKAPEDVPAPAPEGDMVSEVGTKLAQQIFDAAQGNLASLTQEQLATVIADALRPAVAEEAPAPEPAAPPAERQEEMAGKSLDVDVSTKALSEMLGQITKDQGDMARQYIDIVAKANEGANTAKALKPVVDELVKAVNAIRERLDDRPRIASTDASTIVDETTEAGKAIASAAEKGVNQAKTFMGVPVKNIPK
jgi:hypothetical protein